jgi:hypothetical protein
MKDWPIHMLIAAAEKTDGLCTIQIILPGAVWNAEQVTTVGGKLNGAAAVLE